MKRRNLLAAGGAAVVLGTGWTLSRPTGPDMPLLGAASAQTADVDTSTVPDMIMGAADAPITVIEYASFTCPHCAAFHANQFQQLKTNYIDTGKVRFIYREVYFDLFGLWASMVARCGGDLRFFGIADLIYTRQSEWTASRDPETINQALRTLGKTAGLDDVVLDKCLEDEEFAQTLVAWYQENTERDDVSSTPTFLIDGTKYSNMNYADFAAILDGILDT